MNFTSAPRSLPAFCTPSQADWLKLLSSIFPTSVTSPTRSFLAPAAAPVVAAAAGVVAAAAVGAAWEAAVTAGAACVAAASAVGATGAALVAAAAACVGAAAATVGAAAAALVAAGAGAAPPPQAAPNRLSRAKAMSGSPIGFRRIPSLQARPGRALGAFLASLGISLRV